ncbi:MAG TPA: orotate phosphoribosyltransferase [Chthoniobacteraceae bacterium]|nr:orotate phosphoribosyltransferase [Chthoniobacteraceae bacterium]
MDNDTLLDLFRRTEALLEGHFVLRSGLHSRQFFQCALLLSHTDVAEKVCAALADRLRATEADSVISPALGGLIVGHEVARSLGKRHIFAEKENDRLVLRRGFSIRPGERFLVLEDVVTRGGRVLETVEIVRARGGVVVGVGALVDRSGGNAPDFGAPFTSLVQLNVETFEPGALPPDLAALPAVKPGSR